jgi:hypothetical protein
VKNPSLPSPLKKRGGNLASNIYTKLHNRKRRDKARNIPRRLINNSHSNDVNAWINNID